MDAYDIITKARIELTAIVTSDRSDMKLNCLFSTNNYQGGPIFYTSNTVRTEVECAIENMDEAIAILERCGYGERIPTREDILDMIGDERAERMEA